MAVGQDMNWHKNEFLNYFYLVLFLNCIFSTFKQKHKIRNTKYNALKFLQHRGICSRLWLMLWNPIFIAWGRLKWNIVHWVNGLPMRKMLIKIPRIAIQIGYNLFFFPQVISVFHLNFSTVLRRTTQMVHKPPLVCLRHQCILPSIFAFAQ